MVVRTPEPDDGLSAELRSRLGALRSQLQQAPTRRFSAAEVVVDRAELLDLVDQLEQAARVSVQAAATVVRHRNEVLAAGHAEAAKLVHSAELEQERLVSDTEVFRRATRLAAEREAEAEQRAATLRRETDAYVGDRLARLEETLTHTLDAVRRGQQRLGG
ncbi:hypothetical protein D9V37_04425 [Nocardioides mangrovicus]|uniref:ATPase n=1 Tax=Nocardioides mangrovicus TaxID=2478913 RepID=A0A3L8P8G1_9ACTN|nr:hypothetical protein [Nocardioides mangrovicus]RLV51163.1 hypothetical protein D9V37_04425 [Nocardioides mangrovicus]